MGLGTTLHLNLVEYQTENFFFWVVLEFYHDTGMLFKTSNIKYCLVYNLPWFINFENYSI